MERPRTLPLTLKVVAALFFELAGLALAETVISLYQGRVNLDLGLLGFFIGRGLLRTQPGWRICALVFVWLLMLMAALGVVLNVLYATEPLYSRTFGRLE